LKIAGVNAAAAAGAKVVAPGVNSSESTSSGDLIGDGGEIREGG